MYYPEVDLGPFTFKVETTSDGGTTWHTCWVSEVTQTIDPTNINVLLKNEDVGSANFQFSYTFEGYNENAFSIYIDALRYIHPSQLTCRRFHLPCPITSGRMMWLPRVR